MSELYYRRESSFNQDKNAVMLSQYLTLKDQPETLKTHFFEGRFENVYIESEKIFGITELMQEALEFAFKYFSDGCRLIESWFLVQ